MTVNFEVLSINADTKRLERMSFDTLERAQAHKLRAESEGRLLVAIVQSPEEHREWDKQARNLEIADD
jgi:hypothetical protein